MKLLHELADGARPVHLVVFRNHVNACWDALPWAQQAAEAFDGQAMRRFQLLQQIWHGPPYSGLSS